MPVPKTVLNYLNESYSIPRIATKTTVVAGTSPNSYPFDSLTQMQSIHNTVTPEQLLYTQSLINNDKENMRNDLLEKKKELHQQSLNTVKNWENTIMGKRKKRLQNLEEKKIVAESIKQKIDEDWKVLQEKEKSEFLNKVKRIREQQTASFRNLNSSLLIQEVKMERDLQLKEKDRRNKYIAEAEEMFKKDSKELAFLKAKKEYKELVEARERRHEVAKFQVNQAQKKLESEKHEKEDLEILKINQKRIEDIEREKKNSKIEKQKKVEEYAKCLDMLTEENNLKNLNAKLIDNKILLETKKFNSLKQFLENKKKDINKKNIQDRFEFIEKIGERQLSEAKRKELLMDKFFDQILHFKEDEPEKRRVRELEKVKKYNAESKAFREEKKILDSEAKKVEKLNNETIMEIERLKLEKEYIKQKENQQTIKQHLKSNFNYNKLKVIENLKLLEEKKLKEKLNENLKLDELNLELKNFENYGKEILEEYNDKGEEVTTNIYKAIDIQKKLLRRNVKGESHTLHNRRNECRPEALDTFSRLGF